MRWTKSLLHPSTSSSSPSSSSTTPSSPSRRAPPVIQRTDSSSGRPPRRSSPTSPPLPSDAIDLVVEDHSAAEDEHTTDRRKGPPSSHLKKIYRRGFETDVSGKGTVRGEVEVESGGSPESDRRRVDHGERIAEYVVQSPGPPEEVVATVETPPLHARVDAYHFDNLSPGSDHEHNPWA